MGDMSGMPMAGGYWLLPQWLASAWALAFLAIIMAHCRHLLCTYGQRRAWHCVHVVMGLSMMLMYAPLNSIGHGNVVWLAIFAGSAVVVLAWLLTEVATRRAVNGLWVLVAADLVAMAYMWSPGGSTSPAGWVAAAYFAVQTALWATNSYHWLDERLRFAGIQVTSAEIDQNVAVATRASAEPLMARLHLRASMVTMTLGMAYMFVAMQLMGWTP